MEGTITFMVLLDVFQPVFTQPSFATFRLLMTGWILSHRHRFVTDLILSSDSVGHGHFSDYHRFFSQARWSIDRLWQLLAGLLIKTFFGSDAVILLAGDDTLCRKRGLGLFGAGMHHDPLISSKAKKLVSWGHDWVTLALVIVNPWWAPTKVFSLPIAMRLYRNRQGALVDDDLVEGIKRKLRRSKTRLRFSGKYPAARIGRRADTRKTMHLHYIVWEMVHGRVRRGQMIDHVNQNLLDNRLENLAAVDASERQANSPKHSDNSTGFKGVSKNTKGRFVAKVGKDGKLRHLGVYDTTFAAAHAVNHGYAILFPTVWPTESRRPFRPAMCSK